jgi:hypothetical protein
MQTPSAVRCALSSRTRARSLRRSANAWLGALRRHWPDAFARVLGPDGDASIARCTSGALDWNRYLKLRRIATENLAFRV